MGHLQNVTGGQIHGLPHMGVGVAAQNDLLAVVIQPLAQRAHVHGFGPAHQFITVPLSVEGRIIDLLLPPVQGRFATEDIHFQVRRQLEGDRLRSRNQVEVPDSSGVTLQRLRIQLEAEKGASRSLGQVVIRMEGVQLRGIFRRQIGGVKPVDGHGIQHPAKTADVIPVEMRGQSHIQMGHAQLPKEISRIDPLRPGIQLSRMIVPYQTVMAKIYHQGKLLLRSLHLPNENTVSVAYVDKVQSQHTQSPPLCCCYKDTIPRERLQRKAVLAPAKISLWILTVPTRNPRRAKCPPRVLFVLIGFP